MVSLKRSCLSPSGPSSG